MLPLAAAFIALVTQDRATLRTSAAGSSPVTAVLSQGEALEVRGARAGFLQVYQYDRERGGYVPESQVRQYPLETTSPGSVLENVRLLRDMPGLEALGIAHVALYLKLVPSRDAVAEAYDALGAMAERLARRASARAAKGADPVAAPLDVARAYGVRFVPAPDAVDESRVRTCYDGEAWREVLRRGGTPEARARAALGLTSLECEAGSAADRQAGHERALELLAAVPLDHLPVHVQARIRLRRVAVSSALAFERARAGRAADAHAASASAVSELALVSRTDLAEADRPAEAEAVLRASVSRPAADTGVPVTGRLVVTVAPRAAGETCVSLAPKQRPARPLVERCTYGQVWPSSVHVGPGGASLAVAVQPLASWRELWVFRPVAGTWTADVIVPAGATTLGYVEWAGWTPDGKSILAAREVLVEGRLSRSFEMIDLETLDVTRRAQRPEDLTPFYRWQAPEWRGQTLALR
ncbi:MAG: hypothetical protein U0599_05960 [Vicinamibacteria bacterium]